ncbi:MAG TPA: 2Fe-2S iron-sulfur cluster-binding protein, partial [Bauldia sp.]|nr:2Fe-2S iron-sulfur cluster-binding protein [Bauldia sp.]
MTQPSFRLKRPEPSAEVRFSFNGRELSGLAGEPLSAALLANGIHLVGRSFKYHRPRGIVSSGVEEPSALLQVGTGARITPNLPATEVRLYEGLTARSQNCYPSVAFDLGAINRLVAPFIPAGFYYKTFMGPRPDSWMFYERFIRRAAGLGIAPIEDDPDEYDQTHHHCDVLVVGAGPAGMAAALTAGRSGLRVLLVERQPEPGGSLLAEPPDSSLRIDGQEADRWLRETDRSLRSLANVTVLTGTNVFGRYRHNWYAAVQTLRQPGAPGPGVRERLWKIRAKHVVFATGAIERMLVFANNDLPGVMLAGAVRDYAVRHGVAAGRRVVFVGNNDTIFRAALDCREAGLNVVAVLDIRAAGDNRLSGACRAAGIPVAHRVEHLQASGGRRVSRLRFTSPQGRQSIACDVVGMSAGWAPAIHLHSQLEGTLRFDESSGAFLPIVDDGGPYSIGACAGTM